MDKAEDDFPRPLSGPPSHKNFRFREIDFLRGFAVLCMIAVHTQMYLQKKALTKLLLGKIIKFLGGVPAAPTFLYLMGYLIGSKKPSPWSEVFPRAAKLLLLGYTLNFLRFTLPGVLGAPFTDEAWSGLWMIDILQLAAPALIVLRLIQGWPSWALYGLVAAFSSGSLILTDPYFQERGVLDFIWGRGDFVFFPMIPWMAYPIWGILGARLGSGMIRGAVGLFLLVAGGCASFYFWRGTFTYYFSSPTQMAWMLGFVWVWQEAAIQIVKKIPGRIESALKFFSANVTFFYFVSWMLICWSTFLFGYRTQNTPITLTLICLFTALTSVICLIWKKVRTKLPAL